MHTLRSWRQIITQTVADSVISASQVDWTGNGSSNGLGFDGQEGATEEMWATGLNQTTEASELVAHRMPRPNYHLILGEPKHSIDLNLSFRIVFYLIYGLIFAFGIIGNLLVCWVVFRQTSMRTVTNIFIANLALSDILLCLFCVPFTPLYLLAIKEWQFGQFSNLLCHLVPFAQGVSVYLSVFTMCAISIERYSVIVHPFRSPITVSSCIIIIFFIWVFAIILTLPYGIFMQVLNVVHILPEIKKYIHHGNETGSQMELTNQSTASEQMSKMDSKDSEFVNEFLSHPKEMALNPKVRSLISLPKLYCDEMWPGDNLRVIYGITTTIIQFIMPFCIITFCYFKVCARLWDRVHTRPGNRNCSNQRKWLEKERARRTTQMLIWMVIFFAVSWFPISAYNLIEDFYSQVANWAHSKTLFFTFHLIAMSSSIYNPLLYAWLNDNFRKEFKSIFVPLTSRCFRLFGRPESSLDQAKELRNKANNAPGQSATGKKADSSNVNFGKHNKNCTFTTDLKGSERGKDDAVDDVEISMTVLDTTTNLVTNMESINEFELLESLMVTSVRNGIYANRVLPPSGQAQAIVDTNKL